jgi:plastocyanin
MRTTLGLWLLTALLGVLTWAVVNKGLFAATPTVSSVATAEAGVTVIRLIAGNKFDPQEISIPAGTTIQFVNADTRAHTVTADDASFDSGNMKVGDTFNHTFTQPGDVLYYCDFHGGKGHEGMAAVIHVTGEGAIPNATTAPTNASATTAATTPATAPVSTAAATSAASDSTSAVVVVAMLDDRFDPAEITIAPGTTIRWENKGKHKHTITADDGNFDSGQILASGTFEQRFDKVGDLPVYCINHGDVGGIDMAMVIHIKEGASGDSSHVATEEATQSAPVATEEATQAAPPTQIPTVIPTTAPTKAPTLALDASVATAIVPLTGSADDTPNKTPYVTGTLAQMAILKAQSAIVSDALKQGHYEDALSGAEAILNVIDGGAGKDRDTDGTINQPGDGYGLKNYIFSVNENADTVQQVASDPVKAAVVDIQVQGRNALKDMQTLTQQAEALLSAKTLSEARQIDLAGTVSKLDADNAKIGEDAAIFSN